MLQPRKSPVAIGPSLSLSRCELGKVRVGWKDTERRNQYHKLFSQHLVLTSPCPCTLLASASARSLERRRKGQPPPLGLGEGSRTVFLCHLPTLARYKGKAPSNFH